MFNKKTPYLSAFYRCHIYQDLKKKNCLPNKGALAKVTDGELDRKKKSQLLIKFCYDIKLLPVIATPEAPTVEIPTISIVPLTFIDFNNGNDTISIDRVSDEWLKRKKHVIQQLEYLLMIRWM